MRGKALYLIMALVLMVELASHLAPHLLKNKGVTYQPILVDDLSEQQRTTLRWWLDRKESTYQMHSPILGWTLRPGGRAEAPHQQTNAQGTRNGFDVKPTPPPGRVRIAAFGDSYTHGDEVDNRDTWVEQLNRHNSAWEVLNFGVSGYGLDQAFLRHCLDGRQFSPRRILIGFMSEDYQRNVSVYRPWLSRGGTCVGKPRFFVESGALRLQPNPTPLLGDLEELVKAPHRLLAGMAGLDFFANTSPHEGPLDFLASVRAAKLARRLYEERWSPRRLYTGGIYNERSEAFQITGLLLEAFERSARAAGAEPLVLLFPSRQDLLRLKTDGRLIYDPLVDFLREKDIPFLDLRHALLEGGDAASAGWKGDHYSPAENALIARAIEARLREPEPEARPKPKPRDPCDEFIPATSRPAQSEGQSPGSRFSGT